MLNDPESVEHYRKSILIQAEVVAEGDKNRDLPRDEQVWPNRTRRDLATTHRVLGRQLKGQGDPEAEQHLVQSVKIQAELVADAPNVPYYRAELAWSRIELGDVLLADSRPAEAEKQFQQAMAQLTELVGAHADSVSYRARLALCHISLGNLRTEAGERSAAANHYRQAFDLIEEVVKKSPKNSWYVRFLAWNLATCLDPKLRDAARAVRVGKELVEMTPRIGDSWSVLGVAHYRAGDWKAAALALEKGTKLKNGGDSWDWIFLAMVHRQLGHAEEARRCYERAVKRTPSDVAFYRFRDEAAALLGIAREQKAPNSPKPPGQP
jgi:tetratricopeptide (TPR) repeat protein